MERKRVSLVGPVLLIGLGVILLLNNLGYLDWSLWNILQLWPVLLIAAGLEILLGRHSVWGSLVAALLVLVLIVGGVALVEQVEPVGTRGELTEFAYPIGDAEAFILDLNPAVARLTLEPLDDGDNIVEGMVQLWRREALDQSFTDGERARLVLGTDSREGIRLVTMGRAAAWDLRVSPEVQTKLSVDLGIGEVTLRLTELAVDDADVEFGMGRLEMALSEATSADIAIDGGIGTIRVSVPEGLGVRFIAEGGLVTRDVPDAYSRDGNTYTSPNWEAADYRTTVTLNLGIGTIAISAQGDE